MNLVESEIKTSKSRTRFSTSGVFSLPRFSFVFGCRGSCKQMLELLFFFLEIFLNSRAGKRTRMHPEWLIIIKLFSQPAWQPRKSIFRSKIRFCNGKSTIQTFACELRSFGWQFFIGCALIQRSGELRMDFKRDPWQNTELSRDSTLSHGMPPLQEIAILPV